MSTALEAASLIMIPTSYSDGLLASVKPNDGAGDFTFTRGSNISATRVNADGYIEKGYENLLYPSNDFSVWAKTRTSVTSGQVGYDGSTDAWLLEASATTQCWISKSHSATGICSFSVYAKANTATGVLVALGGTSGTGYARFDLTNGVTGSVTGNGVASSIEAVGDGWYRCSMFTTNTTITLPYIYVIDDVNTSNATAGNSIYIQDAMLNQGMVAYPYVETTTAPVAGGILEDMPRIDFSGGNQSLLLEPSRTNVFPDSEYFDGSFWTKGGNADIENNAAISPEGVRNASKFYGNTTNYTFARIQGDGAVLTQGRTLSVFAKAGEVTEFLFFSGNLGQGVFFNLNNGLVSGYYQGVSSEIDNAYSIDYGNGWRRYVVVFSANSYVRFFNSENQQITFNQTAGNGIYLYGFQAEQDAAYPTSYIPTYGVSQTRLQDDMTNNLQGLDISSILGVSSYTIFFDVETENIGTSLNVAGNVCSLENPSRRFAIDTRFSTIQDDSSSTTRIRVDVGDDIKHYKGALQVTPTTATIFGNGIKGDSGTSRNLSPQTLYMYNLTYNNDTLKINQFLIFPTALSDEECITLTTI